MSDRKQEGKRMKRKGKERKGPETERGLGREKGLWMCRGECFYLMVVMMTVCM